MATMAGLEFLKKGGNAVVAAGTIGFVMAVTLPRAGNIGGGCFMVIKPADSDEVIAVDYREKAPAKAFRDMFLDKDGNADPQLSGYSHLASGVPGTVASGIRAGKNTELFRWQRLRRRRISTLKRVTRAE
jgi:gamma-glutamyltranspeptidase/glutathione hydrolase